MAHAQVPGTFQGRAGEAQLRLACRCGQDLDMAGADPQAETAAQRPATKAGRNSGQTSCSAGARILFAKRAP